MNQHRLRRSLIQRWFNNHRAERVGRTIVDKSGIAGKFKFPFGVRARLHMRGQAVPAGRGGGVGNAANPSIPAPSSDPGPDLFVAVQEQIGLKLSSDKGPVSFLMIDHVEKPTAN